MRVFFYLIYIYIYYTKKINSIEILNKIDRFYNCTNIIKIEMTNKIKYNLR